MKDLRARLNKISSKFAPIEVDMVFVDEGETVESAVKKFNQTHNKNLTAKKVKYWRNFPFKNGKFFIGKDWSIDKIILQLDERRKNEKL